MIVPVLIGFVAIYATYQGVDIYAALLKGGREGLELVIRLLPALVALLTAITMLRASGALDLLAHLCAPFLRLTGISPELLPLMFTRPISGSAALGVASDLIAIHGVDSQIGRTAAVMLGSTETTFYTISIYLGTLGITKTRYVIPVALCADMAGFLGATWSVGYFYG
ncbi:MAG: nucleoside recognition domain-containing protein [Eubacteriales bacterium]